MASAWGGYRGQIGDNTALPHVLSTERKIKKGDVLITDCTSDVAGYCSELERAVILGKPTEKQKKYFEIMVKMQDAALNTFGQGSSVVTSTKQVSRSHVNME